jgi:hypothetical protein
MPMSADDRTADDLILEVVIICHRAQRAAARPFSLKRLKRRDTLF